MKQLLLVLFLTLTPAAYLTAATVKGWVKDAQTGEELIGAAVYVKENPAMGNDSRAGRDIRPERCAGRKKHHVGLQLYQL